MQELEERRKKVVVALFDTIHNDVIREIDNCVQTEQFQKRVAVDYKLRGSLKCVGAFTTNDQGEETDEATELGAKYLASSFCYISSVSILLYVCVLILLCMCPHTGIKTATELANSDLYVSPLKWKEAGSEKPSTGTEIENEPLAAALQNQVKFTKEEWKDFQVVTVDGEAVNPGGHISDKKNAADLSSDSYIKAGNRYFKPEIKPYKDLFIDSIKSESAARAEVYKGKPGAWFASNANLGKAVIDGLALSTLAKAQYDLWLRDTFLSWNCYDPDDLTAPKGFIHSYLSHDYQRSYGKLLALQRKELTEAEEAAEVEGSDADAGKRLQELALEECVSRRWIRCEKDLEQRDEMTSFTPLMTHLSLGDLKVAERLLQARASPEAVPTKDKEGKTPLLWACKEKDADATLLLLKYKANIEAYDTVMYTQISFYVYVYR